MNAGKKFLSDLKLHSDYLKWQPTEGRYETWNEACESIINGHKDHYAGIDLSKDLEYALKYMQSKTVLASQRNLQYRNEQIERNNARLYNCSSMYAARNTIFQEVFYLALSGCGVGLGLLIPFVNNISQVNKRTKGTKTFIVPDSIEGWSDALGVLMSSFLVDKQPFPEYAGYEIKFDYSQIREKGAFISGGFKAPGPDGLKQSFEKIEEFLNKWIATEGTKLRPIAICDILCHASDAVLSGGVRRSALNMIVDPNDDEMINAKVGNWRTNNPQRGRTNNSVLLLRSLTGKEEFEKLVKMNDGYSDIGFAFANSWFDMFNPCFEILKHPILHTEITAKINDISYEEIEGFIRQNQDKLGVAFCNLCEINAEQCDTVENFYAACIAGAIIGTLQAGYTSFPYLGETTEKIVRQEALLGVSVTGWMNNPMLFNADILKQGASLVKTVNKVIAEKIGINQAARTTCVKICAI